MKYLLLESEIMLMHVFKNFFFIFHDKIHYFLLGSSCSCAKAWHPTISITDLLRRF